MKYLKKDFFRDPSSFAISVLDPFQNDEAQTKNNPLIIGIGTGGKNIVYSCLKKNLNAQYIILENNIEVSYPKKLNKIKFSFSQIEDALGEKKDKVILVNGLGGNFGTRIARKLFNDLIQTKKRFFWICSYPFKFEGVKKKQFVKSFTNDIAHFPNIILFDNEEIRSRYGDISFQEAFKISDDIFIQNIKNVIDVTF